MSQYIPQHGTLKSVKRDDGWWVDDMHGPLEGPYATQSDAVVTIENIERGDALWMETHSP